MLLSSLLSLSAAAQTTVSLAGTTPQVRTKGRLDVVITAGSDGLSAGDQIRIDDPVLHGMRWSKWGFLSTDPDECTRISTEFDRASVGLVSAQAPPGVTVSVAREPGGPDIHQEAYTLVTLDSGALSDGQVLHVNIGSPDTSPSCGFQFPDRAFQQVPLRVSERRADQSEWTELDTLTFDLDNQPAQALLLTAPSYAALGEPLVLKVAVLDSLGNPATDFSGQVQLSGPGVDQVLEFSAPHEGWQDVELTPGSLGVLRVSASADAFSATSNPVLVREALPETLLFWGDIHVHHGHHHSDESGAVVDQNHRYARDVVGLDVVSESMKWSPVEIDGEALWEYLSADCQDSTTADYLVLRGGEWMGLLEDGSKGWGHHNVYYDACEVPYSSQEVLGLDEAGGLYDLLRSLEAEQGVRAVAIPHASRYTGYSWAEVDHTLRPAVEVFSSWGESFEPIEANGSVGQGVSMGNRFGFIAASDSHDGWMGNGFIGKNVPGGLAAFWAPSLTRSAIFDSLAGRRTYATTGPRILLEFWVEDGATVPAGSAYIAQTPTVHAAVHGTAPVSEVRLVAVPIDGSATAELPYVDYPDALDTSLEWTFADWDGRDQALWLVVLQEDGESAWSSPIWLTRDCESDAEDPAGRCPPADTDTGTGGDSTIPAVDSELGSSPARSRCSCGGAPASALWFALPLLLMFRRRSS